MLTLTTVGVLAVPAGMAMAQSDTTEPAGPVPTCVDHDHDRERAQARGGCADQAVPEAQQQQQRTHQRTQEQPQDGTAMRRQGQTATATTPSGVTDDDVAGLLWVREEEQLAHDVYVVLGGLWGLQIFENIAESESSHVGAVLGLLDRYGITDPAAGNDLGTFTDPEIQAMYDELVADGSTSIDAALSAGALIEELDIDDLQARAAATEIPAITRVYANLETGSRNHLRAFVSQLQSRGVTYEPTQLDASTFDAIVSSEVERGPRR